MSDAIVLLAHVYDALKESAEKHGGIGGGRFLDKDGRPLCKAGHLGMSDPGEENTALNVGACDAGLFAFKSDSLVHAINYKNGVADLDARVPFDEYVREGNVVRGDAWRRAPTPAGSPG
jgi:hypothetical protein